MTDPTPTYTIRRVVDPPEFEALWDGPAWSRADVAEVCHFHPKSSDHRPRTWAKVLYDDEGVYVLFRVEDRYVRSVHTAYNAMVCRDSCVEFFVQPKAGLGYFNFEMNCGGTLHVSYVEDPTRTPEGLARCTALPEALARNIVIHHTLSRVVEPEIRVDVAWRVEYAVPYTVFEAFVGPLGEMAGQEWRGNFYKCGDETSHPHWAAWAPIGEELNFHQPRFFAPLRFGAADL